MLMQLPRAARTCAARSSPTSASRDEVSSTSGCTAQFDTRDTERALEGSGIEVPPLETYADKLWDYWERNLDPDLFKDRSFEGAVNGKTVVITGALERHRPAAALKIAAAGGIPLLVARSMDKLEELKAEIEAAGGTAYAYSADLSDMDAIDGAGRARSSPTTRRSTCSSTTPGRSIRRAISSQPRPLPRLRAHDAAQLLRRDQDDHGAAAAHDGAQGSATSSTSPRSACRPTRRASAPTSRRRRRSTRGRAWSARR